MTVIGAGLDFGELPSINSGPEFVEGSRAALPNGGAASSAPTFEPDKTKQVEYKIN